MLGYDYLPHALFSDTLIVGSVSKHGKKYAQMYGASFDWWRALHMGKKGYMHENLYLLFKYDRVTPEMIVGKAIENILGEFHKKLKEANCHLR